MRNILILCVFIFTALGAIYFFVGNPRVNSVEFARVSEVHLYKDAERKIPKINVLAFYFLPKNKAELAISQWEIVIEASLEKLASFHSLQFQEKSEIKYKIFPRPIVGLKDSLEYDTEETHGGNPQALLNVSDEIEKRVFKNTGDLYNADFIEEVGEFTVLAIMYEGVGAAGGVIYESELGTREEIAKNLGLPESVIHIADLQEIEGFFLVNRVFLTEPEYEHSGTSIFAHEFYHTLGIPDEYKIYKAIPTSDDIMGLGRHRPIEKTYIKKSILKNMSL